MGLLGMYKKTSLKTFIETWETTPKSVQKVPRQTGTRTQRDKKGEQK